MDALIKISRGEADVSELVEARQTLGQMLEVIEDLPYRLKGLVDADLQKRTTNVTIDNRVVAETVKREVDKQFSVIRDEVLNKYGSLDNEMISSAFKEHNDRFATAIQSYESRIDKLVGLKAKTKNWFTMILSSLLVVALVTGASIGFFAPLVHGFFTGSGITDLLVQGRDNVFAPSADMSWGLRIFSALGTIVFALIYYGLPFVCMFGLLKFLRRQDWF